MLGTELGIVNGITPGHIVGTEMVILDQSYDSSNGRKVEVLMLESLLGLLMVKCLYLMKASYLEYVMVKSLALYIEMWMKSHMVMMLKHSWFLYMDPFIALMMASLRGYYSTQPL